MSDMTSASLVSPLLSVGWSCPKCGRCYAPYVPICGYCVPDRKSNIVPYIAPNTGDPVPRPFENTCEGDSIV